MIDETLEITLTEKEVVDAVLVEKELFVVTLTELTL